MINPSRVQWKRPRRSIACHLTVPSVFPLALTLVVTLFLLVHFPSSVTSASSLLRCSSVSPYRFNPRLSPSPSSSLTFCTSYASSTCCNASHTVGIVKAVYPFFSFTAEDRAEGYGVSEECKNLAASIHCAPCHPLVGTQQKRGICTVQQHSDIHSLPYQDTEAATHLIGGAPH